MITWIPLATAQGPAPDGSRLGNDMITPIHVVTLKLPGEGAEDAIMHLRLRDADGYQVGLFVERGLETDENGETSERLRLHLYQPPGKIGSRLIEAQSAEEKHYLAALDNALEHYVPGWTQDWSVEGHRQLRKLVDDLQARQQSRWW